MLYKLIQKYKELDEDTRRVVNLLALTNDILNINEISEALPDINFRRLNEILKQTIKNELVIEHSYFRNNDYIANDLLTIWLFPILCNTKTQIFDKKSVRTFHSYHIKPHRYLFDYLSAICFLSEKQIEESEHKLFSNDLNMVHNFWVIFEQPAYNDHIIKLSNRVIDELYLYLFNQATEHLSSFARIAHVDSKLKDINTVSLNIYRTKMAIIEGKFDEARMYADRYHDEAMNYFVEAIFAFIGNDIDNSLSLFEKGMKRQRRTWKNKYLPLMPEIAMFYLSACLSKTQEFYMSLFMKISTEKGTFPTSAYVYFHEVCSVCISSIETSERLIGALRRTRDTPPEQILWKTVALGLMDQKFEESSLITKYLSEAEGNGHFVLAYEVAYLLEKWYPSSDNTNRRNRLALKLKYEPILSHVRHPDDWEKQLNSYFSLEAVKMSIRQESGNGRTRIAYRFYPNTGNAMPVLQSRSNTGLWSFGRNITINSFVAGKVDCMSEHDRRIAAAASTMDHLLQKAAIVEMIGHPYVYLEDSDISIEIVADQPVISVVKLANKTYKLECIPKKASPGVVIRKETNTRYRVYNLTALQCQVIKAVTESKPVPEAGYEKLKQILKHFSVYAQIQSDLNIGDDDERVQLVESDSRIRVQLLPMGDGIKAELFVKPFGAHPPYCKPGRGGRSLIATENGERVRVIRDLKLEKEYNERILNDIQSVENINSDESGLMSFDNLLDTLELLDILERHQDISIVEWPEGERLKIRRKISFDDLNMSIKSHTNWFEVEGELRVDEQTVLSLDQLLSLVRNAHGRFVELSAGEFLALSDKLRRRLSELSDFGSKSKNGISVNRFASASIADTLDDFDGLKADREWHEFRNRLQTVQLSNAPVPELLMAELRPYQVSGYQWMIRLSEWGAGACLADDMGLGKTVQTIAVLLHRATMGAAMVVSPVSVMPNWISEVNRFAPTLNVKTLKNVDRSATISALEAGDLLITSYGLLLSEEKTITSRRWTTVVLDEAHAIKNYNTKTSKAAMALESDFRIILTGTPIQNHLGEMWNLFQFINPGLLGSLSHFTETYIRQDNEKMRKRLKKLITPFILRRTKTAVLEELPPKTEIVRKITLSDEEAAFYETLRRHAIEQLENDESPQGAKHLKVLAEITRLRQACCNPALVYPELNIESTKLSTFLEIAAELKDNGHRSLVFSQFVTHLSIVRKALDKAGYTYCYLDGSTSVSRRETEVRNFQNGVGDFFLISLKAGGLGLNLTAADYVIHLDPWWNPAIEDQASDRAHRIGQERPVTVYRLVAENTIEEKIIKLHNTKRDLADSLLEGSDRSAKMSLNELISLITE
jgi:SNF2 family DNA or RNA helicase